MPPAHTLFVKECWGELTESPLPPADVADNINDNTLLNMALFNYSKIEGNDNEVQQDVNKGDGFFMKLLQIIGIVATLIGAIVGVIALIK